ncbi:hypothetical protein ACQ4PT_067128 [Festuca glaucescens]
MAALRQATRKLVLHQRTQTSAAVQRRLVHGGTPNSVDRTTKILEIQEKLQGKKEELYSVLAEVERERHYMPTICVGMERFRNQKLLQCLSAQVEPKPNSKWRLYWSTHVMNGVLICGAAAIVVHVGHAAAVRQWEDLKRGWNYGRLALQTQVLARWNGVSSFSISNRMAELLAPFL